MVPSYIEAQFEHQGMVSSQILTALDDLLQGGRENIPRRRVDARLSVLHADWSEFAGNHKLLGSQVSELTEEERIEVKKNEYFSQNLFRSTRDAFLNALEKMTTLLDEIPMSSASGDLLPNIQSQSLTPSIHRLPRLDLPKFNGEYTEWLTFRDLFTSLVINDDSLSPVEKLYHLGNCLTGSAAVFLIHTPLTGDNFLLAWKDLTSYYDNQRVLVDASLHNLFSIKRMNRESAVELEELYTTIKQSIRSLEILGQPVEHWDSILIYLTTRCLDPSTVRAWELELGFSTNYPKWSQLGNFLVSRIRSLQALNRTSSSTGLGQNFSCSKSQNISTSHRQLRAHSVQQASSVNPMIKGCPVCDNDHLVYRCPEYLNQPVERRKGILKQKSLCFNCLGSHLASSCPSTRRCLKCGKRHHTTIHGLSPQGTADNPVSPQVTYSKPDSEFKGKHVHHVQASTPPVRTSVILATVRAKLELNQGHCVEVRLLIDQGSEVSLVSEKLVHMYRLPREKSHLTIIGAGGQLSGRSKGSVYLKLISNVNSEFFTCITDEILPKITSDIPAVKLPRKSWSHLDGLELADPQYTDPSSVDVLLGEDVYHQIIQNGLRKGSDGGPVAQLTGFGWIL